MDLVAGLHWLHENLGAFGGDPDRLTLFGHGTGAALANFLAVSPMARGNSILRFVNSLGIILIQMPRIFDSTVGPCSDLYYPILRLR